jgi:Na+/H+ antiporter NhaC
MRKNTFVVSDVRYTMDAELLRVVGSVAGIGGLGLGILLLLYQEVLRAKVLRRLTKQQAYRLLTLILLLVFLIALLALIAYVGTTRRQSTGAVSACVPLPYGTPLRITA